MLAPPSWWCVLCPGPDYFNIVLNGGPGCCCCGPTPIHRGSIQQRAPSHLAQQLGILGAIMNVGGHMDGQQTVEFNTWVGSTGGTVGVPSHMVGRVDAVALAELVATLSAVEMSQQDCLTQCLACSCAANARNLRDGIAATAQVFGPKLGASALTQLTYTYEYWVPPSTDGNGNTSPGHWQQGSLEYVQVVMPPRAVAVAAAPMMMAPAAGGAMLVPGQPGYVAVNPMAMSAV